MQTLWFPMQILWSSFMHRKPPLWMIKNTKNYSIYKKTISYKIHIVISKKSIRIYQKHRTEMYCPKQEIELHQNCVDKMLSYGWSLVDHEWNVIPNKDEYGKGDLVFKKHNMYMVIECKRKETPKVYEQAQFYAAAWKLRYAENKYPVIYAIWTCNKQQILGVIKTKKEASYICKRDVCNLLL